ncbi:MAG: AAA family ATPase [Acidimicrobiaceae bacterium]|nr:AAA family ATPase [Acidimicrobiaceae bacterium]MYK73424.1 AAA family ATPase [Acidimicrobiaceae bacterium]
MLRAKGFRSLSEVDVPLGPLTVLVGANGSGKTNVLGVLRFLASTVRFDLAAAIDAAGGYLYVLRQDGRGPSSRVVLGVHGIVTTHASVGAPDEYELKFYQSTSDQLIREESFVWKRTPGQGRRLTVKGTKVEFGADDMDEGDRETRQLANRQTTGLATLPDWSDEEGGEGIRLLADFLSGIRILEPDMQAARRPSRIIPGPLADDASNLASALHNLSLSEPDSFAILANEVRACLPGLDAIEFELLGGSSRAVMVVLRERGVRMPIELADASFGTVRLLALLTALHEPNQPPFTAIEEADHGLHPYALDLLVERLRAASEHTQLLVTTHAPTFVNRLRPPELVVCDRDPATGASKIPAIHSHEIARREKRSEYGLGELWFAGALGGVPN